ncbi:heavy metal translocating P-type ATPase [Kineococcus rhizosphaerae]|uniref:Heavy metal-(Cd/Co/Hg/Pb/Zn)-translocating P-type ATPase n=1 Tax=Kineococcus rhizosphaerae TaxID=559628 RepID=A0A2T0R610_9ACTN|nr:heavy metal translocating P-type ATPase [Kineococcus rhizosphaerae]PRY16581.1 heavy metal-(Cd/Co/Hg/Pb/Zn)-translocating P-type ATPase [Kineococcus rhizosphaerae]
MTSVLAPRPDLERAGRVLPRPPSILRTGLQLPEVRWAGLALVLFLVGGALQLTGAPTWAYWAAYLTCYAAGGWEPGWAGLQALREKTFDVDLLMVLAAVAAAGIGQVLDGALLIVIFATSGAVEAIITQRTADSVSSLLTLTPEQATRLDPATGTEQDVDVADLAVDDLVLIRPGERIGADGTVVEGLSEVDQQAITGESVPVPRGPGDEVLSGTVNGTGALRVRVQREAGESVIARVVAMVEQASATKATTQLFIEKVEQRYSLGVVVATLVVLALPVVFLDSSFEDALLRAITFMIVASPCAVVLATMPPLLSAMANAGRHGVLVKSATVMEAVGRTTVFAFDKTGTLTEGTPEVTRVITAGRLSRDQVLRTAAAAEQFSEHPLGRAVLRAAHERRLQIPAASEFQSLPGRGVVASVDGHAIRVERAEHPRGDVGIGTVVGVHLDEALVGTITLVDRLRPDSAAAVAAAAALTGKPVHLLTGDDEPAAADVAARTGIGAVHARLLPQDKSRVVTQLQDAGERVLLVGDGVNDAPALATAAAGVAMGRRGSDLALDTSDAVVVRDEVDAVPRLVALSRRAHRIVVANLVVAATFIVVLVTWDLVGHLPLPLAVAGHEGSTVVVALNGLRLLRAGAWEQRCLDAGPSPTS